MRICGFNRIEVQSDIYSAMENGPAAPPASPSDMPAHMTPVRRKEDYQKDTSEAWRNYGGLRRRGLLLRPVFRDNVWNCVLHGYDGLLAGVSNAPHSFFLLVR
jgi:hypothetical protein